MLADERVPFAAGSGSLLTTVPPCPAAPAGLAGSQPRRAPCRQSETPWCSACPQLGAAG